MSMDSDASSRICQEESCVDDEARSSESSSTCVDAADPEDAILQEDGPSTPDRPIADENAHNSMIHNNIPEIQDGIMPVQGPQMLGPTKQRGWMAIGSEMPYALGMLFLLGYLVWHFFKHKKQHKEWQQSSESHLEQIRLRNLQSSSSGANLDSATIVKKQRLPKTNERASREVVANSEVDPKSGEEISSDEDNNGAMNSTNLGDATAKHDSSKSGEGLPEHISKIRAKQQEQLERNTKSAHRNRNLRQVKKKQILHKSLGHDAAEKARQRRINAMAEEEARLQSRREEQLRQEEEQRQLNELEEMERIALLQQQDLDYQESLLRDQDRSRQLALEEDMKLKRLQAIDMARQRLTIAGVECSAINQRAEARNADRNKDDVRVRLLLPSGQRVEATFAADHAVGLAYDVALVVLDRDNMLWDHQEKKICDDRVANIEESNNNNSDSSDAINYKIIHEEWKQLFNSFALSSTYPQRTYDDLSLTLEESGLSKSAMLMVVVESD